MTKYLTLTTSLLLALGLFNSAQARPVDIIVNGEVERIEFDGTCDEAYDKYPGQVYACVSLQTARPNGGSDCTGQRCVKIKKPWEMQSVTKQKSIVASPKVRRPNTQNTALVCNASNGNCASVDKCNANGTRYQKGISGWQDVPEGWVCEDSVLRPKIPVTRPMQTSPGRK